MSSDVITRFVEQRPFEPFTMKLVDGREVYVPHSDFIGVGFAVQSVNVILPTRQLEVIDTVHVVSIRTFYPSELPST
jgi:hypothetical protein